MDVAVIQSNYLPWKGYFDIIDDVDLFIIHDDLKYTKQDWRNRNRIKTPEGVAWLSVPVARNAADLLIQDVRIADPAFAQKHLRRLEAAYRPCRFYKETIEVLEEALLQGETNLSALNVRLLRVLAAHLGLTTPIVSAEEFHSTGARNEKLLSLLQSAGARRYVTGPSALAYLDLELFRAAGIEIGVKGYRYEPYEQPWGTFRHDVSVVDLLCCQGAGRRSLWKSADPIRWLG